MGKQKKTFASGLVIVHDSKILLVHPTKEKSHINTYSFPKGKIDAGETPQQAAIRETFEEVGVELDINKLEGVYSNTFEYFFKEFNVLKSYTYFIYPLTVEEFDTLFKGRTSIPQEELNLKEIDTVAFYTLDEAKDRLASRFHEILDHVK